MDTKVRKTSVQDTGPAPCSACRTQAGARHRPKAAKKRIRKAGIDFKGVRKDFFKPIFAQPIGAGFQASPSGRRNYGCAKLGICIRQAGAPIDIFGSAAPDVYGPMIGRGFVVGAAPEAPRPSRHPSLFHRPSHRHRRLSPSPHGRFLLCRALPSSRAGSGLAWESRGRTNRADVERLANEIAERDNELIRADGMSGNQFAYRALGQSDLLLVPSKMTSDKAASTASRMRRLRSEPACVQPEDALVWFRVPVLPGPADPSLEIAQMRWGRRSNCR